MNTSTANLARQAQIDDKGASNGNPIAARSIMICVGSYGSRPDNDLPDMASRSGSCMHFAYLRGVSRAPDEQRSFKKPNILKAIKIKSALSAS